MGSSWALIVRLDPGAGNWDKGLENRMQIKRADLLIPLKEHSEESLTNTGWSQDTKIQGGHKHKRETRDKDNEGRRVALSTLDRRVAGASRACDGESRDRSWSLVSTKWRPLEAET